MSLTWLRSPSKQPGDTGGGGNAGGGACGGAHIMHGASAAHWEGRQFGGFQLQFVTHQASSYTCGSAHNVQWRHPGSLGVHMR